MKFNTLGKALEIFEFLVKGQRAATVNEIAQALKMPKSTGYAYVAFLKKRGLLIDDVAPGKYKLGYKFIEYSSLARLQIPVSAIALPHMQKLAASEDETVALAVKVGKISSCIVEQIQYGVGIVVSMWIGVHTPLHCGSSARVLLAHKPDDEIKEYLKKTTLEKLTDNTIISPTKLWDNLMAVRKKGYAYSNGEVDIGVRGISAPIFRDGQVIAALVIVAPSQRMLKARVASLKDKVIETAAQISKEMYHQ